MNNHLNQIQLKLKRELGLFLNARKIPLDLYIKNILSLYKDFSSGLKNLSLSDKTNQLTIKKKFSYPEAIKLNRKYKIIYLMQDFLNEIEDIIEGVYLQGSFATEDFLENWSDLDMIIIWRRNLFEKRDNLLRARKVIRKTQLGFYQIDPLAHHSFHMCTATDLNYYPQSVFLPLVVYENSSLLLGKNELFFRIRKDRQEQINMITKLAEYFKSELKNPPKNLYQLKLDISHLLLTPSFLLQAKDIYVHKKFSFELAKKNFPELDFKVIDWASEIRKNWQTPNILEYYPGFLWKFLPDVFNNVFIYLPTRIIRQKKINFLTEKEIRQLISKSYNFLKDALNSALSV